MAEGPGQRRSLLTLGGQGARILCLERDLAWSPDGWNREGEVPPGVSGQDKRVLPSGRPPRDASGVTCQGLDASGQSGEEVEAEATGLGGGENQLSSGCFLTSPQGPGLAVHLCGQSAAQALTPEGDPSVAPQHPQPWGRGCPWLGLR